MTVEPGAFPTGPIFSDCSAGRQIQPERLVVNILGVAELLVATGAAKPVLRHRIHTIVDELLGHAFRSLCSFGVIVGFNGVIDVEPHYLEGVSLWATGTICRQQEMPSRGGTYSDCDEAERPPGKAAHVIFPS